MLRKDVISFNANIYNYHPVIINSFPFSTQAKGSERVSRALLAWKVHEMMEEPPQSPKRNGPPTSWIPLLTVVREGGGGRKILILYRSAVTERRNHTHSAIRSVSRGGRRERLTSKRFMRMDGWHEGGVADN